MPRRFRSCSRVLFVCAAILCSPSASRAQKKPSTTPPQATYLDDGTVAGLQNLATTEGSEYSFLGLSDQSDGSQRLFIVSNRALIAFNTAKAARSGGRYRPPRAQRADVVTIDCGDEDIGDIFECASVKVNAKGVPVKPFSYEGGVNTYRNAFGAAWSVREVVAVYPARSLVNGFSVTYTSPDGGEWTFDVSAEQASSDLLLTFDAAKHAAAVAAKEKAASETEAALKDEAEHAAARTQVASPRVETELKKLVSPSTYDRLDAAQWFEQNHDRIPAAAVVPLAKAVTDSQWGVRIAALTALRQMGPRASEACPVLAEALRTAEVSFGDKIRTAQKQICPAPDGAR